MNSTDFVTTEGVKSNGFSIAEYLQSYFPQLDGTHFEVFHLQSPSSEVESLYYNVGDLNDNATQDTVVKAEHFIAVSCNKKIFFAIDILIYLLIKVANSNPSKSGNVCSEEVIVELERHLFISKADTNGYCDIKLSTKNITRGILNFLLDIEVQHYLKNVIRLRKNNYAGYDKNNFITKNTSTKQALQILAQRLDNRKDLCPETASKVSPPFTTNYVLANGIQNKIMTKISLFTRPEPQYLFSESSKNRNKHILSGDQLLHWWLSIIDSLLDNFETSGSFSGDNTIKAKVKIPGEDDSMIYKRYICKLKHRDIWEVGTIYGDKNDLSHMVIPLFPDDPKTRFIRSNIEEGRDGLKLKAFWNELQGRQEFNLGIVVGVIGVSGLWKKKLSEDTLTDYSIYIPPTKKKFKNLKRYVIGEEYDTAEGALDSYSNLSEYYRKLSLNPISIIGTYKYSAEKVYDGSSIVNPVVINNLNSLVVHRKKR
ncbi:H3 histone acetyltransferase RTT109 SCDLUD_004674 [Saccharomycodes ludwigii]|uniref:H3 histone acetyltransferase RTT109 n=1 Tax=Saccharomycodes ludwigii TaxID=36035 RepID=UPI001E88AD75|nr:hypothetical protein SCDLUD_004674 [Saccharomycodes ludwigii]KAH3899241.1 hypothetical protein SCDLUD_004674 [Saccharomycodes ludwigii]